MPNESDDGEAETLICAHLIKEQLAKGDSTDPVDVLRRSARELMNSLERAGFRIGRRK
jgi:hypothetical protein